MEINKINDDSFGCVITKKELESRDLSLEDFMRNTEKVQDLLHEVMEMAHDEFGFVARNDSVALRMMPLPDGDLKIIFTGGTPKEQLGSFLAELFKAGGASDSDIDKMMKNNPFTSKQEEVKKEEAGDYIIISFDSLDKVSEYCARINYQRPIRSSLYKDDKSDTYYLVVSRVRIAKKNFERFTAIAGDYGTLVGCDEISLAVIKERCQCLVEKKAVKVMALI